MPRVIQVIESEVSMGTGTCKDMHRWVTQYHTLDGELLAQYDPNSDIHSHADKHFNECIYKDESVREGMENANK